MESIKLYGINITALFATTMPLNEYLQTGVLLLTIIYTIVQLIEKLKNGKN